MVTPSGGVDMDTGLRDVVGARFYIKGSVSGKPENDHFLLQNPPDPYSGNMEETSLIHLSIFQWISIYSNMTI